MTMFRVPGTEVHIMGSIDPKEMDPIEYAMRSCEADEDGRGWDRPARLYYFSTIQGVGLVMMEAMLPENLLSEPPAGLETLYRALTDEKLSSGFIEHDLIPDNMYGVCFMVEGWSVKRTTEQLAAHSGRPSEQPDRVEVRTLLAITAGQPHGDKDDEDHGGCGDLFILNRERGNVPEFKKQTNLFHTAPEDNVELSGRVPNALAHVFVAAMKLSRRDPVVM